MKCEHNIIEVEKATFCPLIFSCTGGAGPSASKAIQRLASRISVKKEDSYSDVIRYIRTKLSFALLRSSMLCLGRALHAPAPCSRSVNRYHCTGESVVLIVYFIYSRFKIATHYTLIAIYHICFVYNSDVLFSLSFASDGSIFDYCQGLLIHIGVDLLPPS